MLQYTPGVGGDHAGPWGFSYVFRYVPGADTNHPGPFGIHRKIVFVPGVNGPYPAPFGINKKTVYRAREADDVLAYIPGVTGMEKRGSHEGENSFVINWWGEGAAFQYPALLASAWYGIKDKFNYREHYGIPRDGFLLMGDSGGFQALTKGVWMEPVDIIKWQEENCDVGIMFDIPPVDPDNIFKPLGDDEFVNRASKSCRNFEIMASNRDPDSELELLKVIHGHDKKRLSYWWDQVEHIECDGLSFAPKPPDPKTSSIVLGFGIDKGFDKVHILLGSGIETVCMLAYASQHFERLTFDSTSFSYKGAFLRRYTTNDDLTRFLQFGEKQDHAVDVLPCDCPICRRVTMEELLTVKSTIQGGLISLHNLYVFLRHVQYVTALASDRDTFSTFLKRRKYNATLKGMDFIDDVVEDGFEVAYKRHYEKRSLRG